MTLKFNVWFLDDGSLIGKHVDLRKALDYIIATGRLFLNLEKCTVWWPTLNENELALYNEDIVRVPAEQGGIKFLGSSLVVKLCGSLA